MSGCVVETAPVRHGRIESLLADVAERRMSEIMGKRDGLGEILIKLEAPGNRTRDLGDLQGVGQPRPVMVTACGPEDLGLVHQAAKRPAVDDAVPVTLKLGAIAASRFGKTATAACTSVACIGGWVHGPVVTPSPARLTECGVNARFQTDFREIPNHGRRPRKRALSSSPRKPPAGLMKSWLLKTADV